MNFNYKTSGFNIIELMIAVALAGVLAATALPSYTAMVKNNCMTTKANSLISSLQYARSEAVLRKTDITIATSKSSGDADYATNEWGPGWTVSDAGTTLRVVELSCATTTFDETTGKATFTYDSSGYTNSSGIFDICDDRTGETGKQITINDLGRPSTDTKYTGCS
jgi:type IV fimbrial biogenesis protein FimT